ncbi:sex-determining region Y protein-like [Scylla paramamosain]|uniref:sex-determining region Y protein-like n=1 Tax=Scylla paramamosain TaxID=85552 RepID=UPI003082EECB
MNAFMLWSRVRRRQISVQRPEVPSSEVSKILGTEWANLTEAEKSPFFAESNKLRLQHMKKYPNYKYRPKRKARNLSTYQNRSCSQFPILLDLMEGFQPFLTTQQAQQASESATHFQEELTQPLTSHNQVASSSFLDKNDTKPHTFSSLNHSAHHKSKFAGIQQPLYHELLHQESLAPHCDALVGPSTSSLVPLPTQYLPISFPFPNSEPTASTFPLSSQVHYPPPLNLVNNHNTGYRTDVFRPWESNSGKDDQQ